MKPHIQLTIEELRVHAHLLNDMIQALEAFGRSHNSEGLPAAPDHPVQTHPEPAAAVRVSPAPKRRLPSNKVGVRDLVEQVASTLGAFTTAEVKAYIRKHHANLASKIGASSYGTALNAMSKTGKVRKSGKNWVWHNSATELSAQEARYREFREQITTGSARINELEPTAD